MLKLVTGSPGDGKTSNELWEFLHAPQYNGRPKYCTPIKGFEPEKHGVRPIETLSVWETLPEGSVIFCDEVQDHCGTEHSANNPPEWIKNLAKHRHSGYDFIVTTQSPMFLHPFARKLCKPHVNYTRPWNMKGISYTWENVQGDPLSKSAKNTGIRKAVTPNPEVFKLYTSTVLDTHKSRPPYKVFAYLALAILLFLGGGGWATYRVMHQADAFKEKASELVPKDAAGQVATGDAVSKAGTSSGAVTTTEASPVWTSETVKPRIEGLAFTAPVYDQLTQPTDFPRVAACMNSESRGCNCFTQQGTPLDVPAGACLVYIKNGSFDPWLAGRHQQQQQALAQQSTITEKPVNVSGQPSEVAKPAARQGASYTVVADSSRTPQASKIN